MNEKNLREAVKVEVDRIMPRLIELSDWIGIHPELGSEEYESSKLLADELEKQGFEVERGVFNMETAFRARYSSKSEGPRIAFLSEYDALPGIGHGCGHNIIGTAGMGAAIATSKVMKRGEILVFGTPAEEGHGPSSGAKKRMIEAGAFQDVDVVWMIHPTSGKTTVSNGFLAVTGVEIEFKGRASHAAASPQEGINALNAAVLTYMAVHANRQQLRRDANAVIHGIIVEGGLASNIIPERSVLRFGVRSSDDDYIPELVRMVENSAKGAAIATGCAVDIKTSPGLKSNIRNRVLEELFYRILGELGEEVEDPEVTASKPPFGSTDFADVTHVVPGIHPMISIAPEGVPLHTHDFAKITLTDRGHRGIEIGAKAMALAAVEILTDPALLVEIKNARKK